MAGNHDAILTRYVEFARVLGEMFSPIMETVVHDLRQPDHSIIAIYNGELTGREVGDPATNLGRLLLEDKFGDVVVGYENESPDGRKMKSSSLAIRDRDGTLLGVMGLNMDSSQFVQFHGFIKQFIERCRSEHVPRSENFRQMAPDGMESPRDEIQTAIYKYLLYHNMSTRILSNGDKREVVHYLYANGFFNTRGAVRIIAEILGLTRPSVYNYRKEYIAKHANEA